MHAIYFLFLPSLTLGGNTDLQGFSHRLSSDLRELMPEHSPIINVEVFPGGNQSWTAVMGANAVRLPTPYGEKVSFGYGLRARS